jgi:hypothetical protein
MKKPHLITISFVVEADGDEPPAGQSEVDELADQLAKAMDQAVPVESPWGVQTIRVEPLDPSFANAGQCAVCGAWTTDRERSDSLPGLTNGAIIDERLLCDEHLPADHRWAF